MSRSKNTNSRSKNNESNNSRQSSKKQSNARESMNKMKYEIANEFGVNLGPESRSNKNSRGESEKNRSKCSKKRK